MGAFGWSESFSDQPAGSACSPHVLQCIFQPLQYFSLTKPAATVFLLLFFRQANGARIWPWAYGPASMCLTTKAQGRHYEALQEQQQPDGNGHRIFRIPNRFILPLEFSPLYCSSSFSETLHFLFCSNSLVLPSIQLPVANILVVNST